MAQFRAHILFHVMFRFWLLVIEFDAGVVMYLKECEISILARLGTCDVHDATIGKMNEILSCHLIYLVTRQSRDHEVIEDHCSAGMIFFVELLHRILG